MVINIAGMYHDIRMHGFHKKIFLYTAMGLDGHSHEGWLKVLPHLAGITFTIHGKEEPGARAVKDLRDFYSLDYLIGRQDRYGSLSLRLNDFIHSEWPDEIRQNWNIAPRTWVKDCPIPEGEDFYTL